MHFFLYYVFCANEIFRVILVYWFCSDNKGTCANEFNCIPWNRITSWLQWFIYVNSGGGLLWLREIHIMEYIGQQEGEINRRMYFVYRKYSDLKATEIDRINFYSVMYPRKKYCFWNAIRMVKFLLSKITKINWRIIAIYLIMAGKGLKEAIGITGGINPIASWRRIDNDVPGYLSIQYLSLARENRAKQRGWISREGGGREEGKEPCFNTGVSTERKHFTVRMIRNLLKRWLKLPVQHVIKAKLIQYPINPEFTFKREGGTRYFPIKSVIALGSKFRGDPRVDYIMEQKCDLEMIALFRGGIEDHFDFRWNW